MKAKTKFQKKIVGLSSMLRPITPRQKEWAISTCAEKLAVISRKTTYCLECGHTWKGDPELSYLLKTCTCPECNTTLEYAQGPRVDKKSTYFSILTTKKGMQVIRMFLISTYYKKKEAPTHHISEVMQHWIDESGKSESLLKPTNGMCWYVDAWMPGNLEVRTPSARQNELCSVMPYKSYPNRRVLPKLKRNGFNGYFQGFNQLELFNLLLSDNKAEILFKSRQYKLLESFKYRKKEIYKYWDVIRLCIRHNYIISNGTNWLDYINLLEYFGKDIHSPKYIFPLNLSAVHDGFVAKKQKLEDIERNKEFQKIFVKQKQRFFALEFKSENLTVLPLKSVDEFLEEGSALKHCIYTNKYFNREDSLILSARIDQKPIETIEVSLTEMAVVQSRGLHNKPTDHHDVIVDLVNNNMNKIKMLATAS